MTWNNYKTWLENNVFVQTLLSKDLTSEAILKYLGTSYSDDQEKELNETINNLMLSLEMTNDDDYHQLPEYDSEKNWEGQIPADIKLGKKSLLATTKDLSPKVYAILARMFNEWQTLEEQEETEEEKQAELEEKLADFLHKNPLEKETEQVTHYSFLTNLAPKMRKEYLDKWEAWLSDFEQLNEEKQEEYKEKKESVEKLVNLLKKTTPEKENSQASNWLTNLPWGNIAFYGGGIVIIALVWNWLKSPSKE